VTQFRVPFEGRQVILIDTPGFADTGLSDTGLSDTDIWEMIISLVETYDHNALLFRIIYLQHITQNRIKGPSFRNINMFKRLCGDNGLKNVMLVTTMWDTASTDQELERFAEREQELTRGCWDKMVVQGSQVRRYWNDRDSGEQLIRELV
jgi:hypothetical protein